MPNTEKERKQNCSLVPREREKYPRLAKLRPSEQQAQKETDKPYINHLNHRNGNFFPFLRSGYEILLLIGFFFFLDRFRFASFLFWVLGKKNSYRIKPFIVRPGVKTEHQT